jgi:hypothetical protein
MKGFDDHELVPKEMMLSAGTLRDRLSPEARLRYIQMSSGLSRVPSSIKVNLPPTFVTRWVVSGQKIPRHLLPM